MRIREATDGNWPAIHPFSRAVVDAVPGAFPHPEHGYVGLHVVFLDLT